MYKRTSILFLSKVTDQKEIQLIPIKQPVESRQNKLIIDFQVDYRGTGITEYTWEPEGVCFRPNKFKNR